MLYLNRDYFIGVSKQEVDSMCETYYNNKWWKSKKLEDLVNHEIMHSQIGYNNSFEKAERLYEELKADKRVYGFCRLVDKQPDEFMNEMYVAIKNNEKIKKEYLDVYEEYYKKYLN